jgi:hypothetical protein
MSRIFGDVRQNGYVVKDIESALKHWTEVLGVGPFFYFETVPVENFQYWGRPSAPQLSIALANSGNLQIELIQQRNEAPSLYRDFLSAGHEGLQHLAYWTDTFDADVEHALELGFRVGHSGEVGGPDGRFVYFATERHPGTVIELSEISGPKGIFFRHIAEEARRWDGSEPSVRWRLT